MRGLVRPLAATLAAVLFYAGYHLWLSMSGAAKLTAAELPAPGERAHYEVIVAFPPEGFHITRMQAIGRLIEVKGRSVYLMDVGRDDAVELARNYWIDDLRPWRGL